MGIHPSLEAQGGLDKEVICKLTEKIRVFSLGKPSLTTTWIVLTEVHCCRFIFISFHYLINTHYPTRLCTVKSPFFLTSVFPGEQVLN